MSFILLVACSYNLELDCIPVVDINDNVDKGVFFEGNTFPVIDTNADIIAVFSQAQRDRFDNLKKFVEKKEKMRLDMMFIDVDKSRRYEIYTLLYERKNSSQIYYEFYFDTKSKKFVFCETSDSF